MSSPVISSFPIRSDAPTETVRKVFVAKRKLPPRSSNEMPDLPPLPDFSFLPPAALPPVSPLESTESPEAMGRTRKCSRILSEEEVAQSVALFQSAFSLNS